MAGTWHPPVGSLDGIGGQPLPAVVAAAVAAATAQGWSDPRRLHHAGRQAGALLDAARSSIAGSLSTAAGTQLRADEVFFTESVLSAQTYALAGCPGGMIMGAVETAALLDFGDARPGSQTIGVDALGRVDVVEFGRALDQLDPALGGRGVAVLQMANTEVGTCQPIEPVAALAAKVPILMDASQGIGRMQLPTGWSMLTASARDWAGPAGVAILVVRHGVRWARPNANDRGWLGGFPNIPAAIGAATALEYLIDADAKDAQLAFANIEHLRASLGTIDDAVVLGDPTWRLPHVLTFSILYASGEALVTELDKRGFAVASGSACVADHARPSHVLAAMGAFTGGNIRISLPLGCTTETVERFIAALPEAVNAARADT